MDRSVKRVTQKGDRAKEMASTLKQARAFHGHLGPFLALGARMGLAGVRELGAGAQGEPLRVTARLKDAVPFSCVLDGLQVTTQCTMGNKRLMLKNDANQIAARFELQNGEKRVEILVNPTFLTELTKLLEKRVSPRGVRRLAYAVVSMPEEKLFTIQAG
jgi:formylmethanofuran dehydrogenase subunit E